MLNRINKTLLYVNQLGIKEVDGTEVDVDKIIYTMMLNKELVERQTFQRLKCKFKNKTIQRVGNCWIIR